MYRTWTASGEDASRLARELETHLNEYAGEIVTVAYAVDRLHHVLVVYTAIDMAAEAGEEAVAAAESIIDESIP